MADTVVAIAVSGVLFGLFVIVWLLSMILCGKPCGSNTNSSEQDDQTVVRLRSAFESPRPYAKRRDISSWHTYV